MPERKERISFYSISHLTKKCVHVLDEIKISKYIYIYILKRSTFDFQMRKLNEILLIGYSKEIYPKVEGRRKRGKSQKDLTLT